MKSKCNWHDLSFKRMDFCTLCQKERCVSLFMIHCNVHVAWYRYRYMVQVIHYLQITFDKFAEIFPICLNEIINMLYFKSTVSTPSICCIIFQIWLSLSIFTRTFQYGLRVPFLKPKALFPAHEVFTCLYN